MAMAAVLNWREKQGRVPENSFSNLLFINELPGIYIILIEKLQWLLGGELETFHEVINS